MPDNVVHLKRTVRRCYRGVDFVVSYIPGTGKWRWEVRKTTTLSYSDEAETQSAAIRAAEKLIDETS